MYFFFFFQAEDGIRDATVTGVQTCALPISRRPVAALGSCRVKRSFGKGKRHGSPENDWQSAPGSAAEASGAAASVASTPAQQAASTANLRVDIRGPTPTILGGELKRAPRASRRFAGPELAADYACAEICRSSLSKLSVQPSW